MMIGTMRAEEARVFDSSAGTFGFPCGGKVEIFWHNGGHMIEADEGDDMPLDDWRDPERPGWYYRFTHDNPVDAETHGPFTTSDRALEDALGDDVDKAEYLHR